MGVIFTACASWKKALAPFTGRAFRGLLYERRALVHCLGKGYSFVARNRRVKAGEVDLVFEDGNALVVVEVRGRAHRDYSPALTIGRAKVARLERLALGLGKRARKKVRVELVEVIGPAWRPWAQTVRCLRID